MKKLIVFLLVFVLTIAVGCKKNPSNPMNLAESESTITDKVPSVIPPTVNEPEEEPELITTNGSDASTNPADIAAFINKYAGVYYGEGTHAYQEWGVRETYTGNMVHYKLRNGQVHTINHFNQAADLISVANNVVVLPSANKLQISNYAKGTIEVLNLREDGLNAYKSFILEKTSDRVYTGGMKLIGIYESLKAYKGTYKSLYDNKERFLSVDESGAVYFNAQGESKLVDNELIIVKDNIKYVIILEQGVYRKLNNNNIDTSTVVCDVTRDFIEDIPIKKNSNYVTAKFRTETRWQGDIPQVKEGFAVTLNEDVDKGGAHSMEGSVRIAGAFGDRYKIQKKAASDDFVAHVTILKGRTLHVMGRYNCRMSFSEDWKTLITEEGYMLTLK